MSKLYFKYGSMGSSKSAQALMCKFNYEQKGFTVFLLKPSIDTRKIVAGKAKVWSRIGIYSECIEFNKNDNLNDLLGKYNLYNNPKSIVIIDECQFLTKDQVNQLKNISLKFSVLCYGLLTNYKTELFEGSKRLVEIADSLSEIKSVCSCGKKANINALIIENEIITEGQDIVIGGDEKYNSMCYDCYIKKLKDQNLNRKN